MNVNCHGGLNIIGIYQSIIFTSYSA